MIHRSHRLPNIAPPGALLKRSSAPPQRTAKAQGERSPDYLALVRQLPCLHCGMEPSEAAHVRYASVLIRDEAWRCQHEAMKALHADGYQTLQIARFVDDAMQVAQQEVVAMEISDS